MDAIKALRSQGLRGLAKLRPVGSRVPRIPPNGEAPSTFDWDENYHTEFCVSGTTALALAVAVAIGERQLAYTPEVILPAYGCPDLVAAVLAQKAKPVLVDLVPDSPHMDLEKVKEAFSGATVAIVGVGLLGVPERLELLSELCQSNGVALIEDSAQCFPPASEHQRWADLIVLSFGRGKPVNLMGGGALLVRKDLLSGAKPIINRFPLIEMKLGFRWKVKRLVFNFLLRRFPYFLTEKLPGLNIGETRFKTLDEVVRLALPERLLHLGIDHFHQRSAMHRDYLEQLDPLQKNGWCFLDTEPISRELQRVARNRFGLLAPSRHHRDLAERKLNRAGVGASGLYRRILPKIDGIRGISGTSDYPNARSFAERLLTLPCHEDVTTDDITLIVRILIGLSRE
ncbi:DegT/DnrJ/EryC1/StrS family aminotransferase [Marinobacter sediminum]|uniref:DegT/DnrJ/EryC1/StrS family aminotransferase n=1 Tax=Marinobacter sediminum TaxID=256323 RepID=UPI00193AD99E|nr:DegT/DnrJ/EryC1/StrS family aminotransferase [Marinobacter sediminum]